MKGSAFYDLAEWLLKNKKCPEGYRSLVSRAYYGALHVALEFLAEMDIHVPRDQNKHEKVPDLLEHTRDTDLRKAGNKLSDLREERNNADYKIDKPEFETETFATQRLKDAGSVIAELNSCRLSKGNSGGRFEKAKIEAKKRADLLFRGVQ